MTILCQTVQNLGKQMQEGFAAERTRRQEDFETESQKRRDDNNKMEQKMTAKMEDGFKGEKMARQQAQDEIKQMAKKDLDAFKEEMKSLQRRSGSTVCSEASTGVGLGGSGTFARPPTLASRFNDIFLPRKMEFKGCFTDYEQCSLQGLTESEVTNFIKDLHKMVPDRYQKYLDWDQIRTEQGTWPTKVIVSMRFKNETNSLTMVGMLDTIKQQLKKEPHRLRGQMVLSTLEKSSERKQLASAHALFYKGLKEVGGDKSKIYVVYSKIEISFFVGGVMAATYS